MQTFCTPRFNLFLPVNDDMKLFSLDKSCGCERITKCENEQLTRFNIESGIVTDSFSSYSSSSPYDTIHSAIDKRTRTQVANPYDFHISFHTIIFSVGYKLKRLCRRMWSGIAGGVAISTNIYYKAVTS